MINKKLLLIIFLALALRFSVFPFVAPHKERMFTMLDSYEYDGMAMSLVENHRFYQSEPASYFPPQYRIPLFEVRTPTDAFRAPVYPLFLAGIYSLFGHKPNVAIIFQLILSSLTCILVYYIGEVFIRRGVGFIAGLLLALDFPTAIYGNLIMTDMLFTFLFLASIYFILKFFREGKRKQLIYSAILLGASALCRQVIIYFAFVMALSFIVVYRRNFIKALLNYCIYILIFLAAVSPWAIRNYIVYDNLSFSIAQGGNLLFYNAAYLEAYKRGGYEHLDAIRKEMQEETNEIFTERDITSPFEKAKIYQELAVERILAAPALYTKIHLIGALKIFATPTFLLPERIFGASLDESIAMAKGKSLLTESFFKASRDLAGYFFQNWKLLLYLPFLLLYLLFIYFLAGYGLCKTSKEKNLAAIFFLFLLIIVYNALVVGQHGAARFRIPLMPYIDLIAAYGLFQLILLRKKKRGKAVNRNE